MSDEAKDVAVPAQSAPRNKQVPEMTISDECKWCLEGEPEWSDAAKCWIHRHPKLDHRCTRKRLSPQGTEPEECPKCWLPFNHEGPCQFGDYTNLRPAQSAPTPEPICTCGDMHFTHERWCSIHSAPPIPPTSAPTESADYIRGWNACVDAALNVVAYYRDTRRVDVAYRAAEQVYDRVRDLAKESK